MCSQFESIKEMTRSESDTWKSPTMGISAMAKSRFRMEIGPRHSFGVNPTQ